MTPPSNPTDRTSDEPRLYALVPCAGVGERAGTAGPKQYEPLAGSTVVGHTLGEFAPTRTFKFHAGQERAGRR